MVFFQISRDLPHVSLRTDLPCLPFASQSFRSVFVGIFGHELK